jgi:hypothetical protein
MDEEADVLGDRRRREELRPDGTVATRHLRCIFDRGFVGLATRNGYVEAEVMERATRGHPLDDAARARNDSREHDRVIVENWNAALKGYWAVMHGMYRGDLAMFPQVARLASALTNMLIRDAPLRRQQLNEFVPRAPGLRQLIRLPPEDSDQESDGAAA